MCDKKKVKLFLETWKFPKRFGNFHFFGKKNPRKGRENFQEALTFSFHFLSSLYQMLVSSATNAVCYLHGLLINRLDAVNYIQTTHLGDFCFYKLKSASSVAHIGLYVANTDSNRTLVKHLEMSSLVSFEEPVLFDVLTVNEWTREWHQPGTIWALTMTRVSCGTTELGIDMINFMSQITVDAVRPDDFFPLSHTNDECYFFGVPDAYVGLCLPDMDCLREHADHMGVSDLIYFGWNGDPVDVISPQEWLGAICCGVALRYKDTAASLQTVQMHLKTDFPEHRMALMSLSNMHNAV